MIISVEEAKKHIKTTVDDSVLEAKLLALELLIRKHTNNNFQKKAFRTVGTIEDGKLYCDAPMFKAGDTIEINESKFNEGLYVVSEIDGDVITIADSMDETDVLVTKVAYPIDVVMGVVNMLNWDLENRDKVGIQSETISRHSVTYFNMDGANSSMGYPKSLLGFLKPYMKARF